MDENEWCQVVPSFPQVLLSIFDSIDGMIRCVGRIPQVHHLLFEEVDQLKVSHLRGVTLDEQNVKEEIVRRCKERVEKIVEVNIVGPNK